MFIQNTNIPIIHNQWEYLEALKVRTALINELLNKLTDDSNTKKELQELKVRIRDFEARNVTVK